MEHLKVPRELAQRYLNDGFSGGEKKRVEILQMAMLKPRIAVLDETDSGLDIDALRIVAEGVNELVGARDGRARDHPLPAHPQLHEARLRPRLRRTAGSSPRAAPELAHKLEAEGYEAFIPAGVGGGGVMSHCRDRGRPGNPQRLQVRLSNPDEAKDYFFKSGRGLSHELVEAISEHKNEPDWMRKFRHKSLDYFLARPMPKWGGDLAEIDFDNIYYYIKPTEKQADKWEDLPAEIKDTLDKLGIPEAEKKYLAGVGAQYESEVVYHKLQEDLEEQGVIFLDMDSGLREHEDLVKQYFGTIIPQNDNKFAALELGRLVGRLVHLRAAGRQDRDAAPGLLPHQRREHGPVRAHADHRRRGRLRALRRGLHRADLLDRLAALGGRRDHRQEGRGAAATRRSRTGRTTSTTSSPSAPSPTRTRRWSGSTATSARS